MIKNKNRNTFPENQLCFGFEFVKNLLNLFAVPDVLI